MSPISVQFIVSEPNGGHVTYAEQSQPSRVMSGTRQNGCFSGITNLNSEGSCC